VKHVKISNNVIRRLPRYLRRLDELAAAGVERISSKELGESMRLTSSQIRQDFSCFGEFGQQCYGYNVLGLRAEIASILGMDRNFTMVVVGVGNIGRALLESFCFEQYGFKLMGAFDVRPDIVGRTINGVEILHADGLEELIKAEQVDAAVLCVQKASAKRTAHSLLSYGIKSIWNFTNVELELDEEDIVVEDIHFSDSLLSMGYYLAESIDQESIRAEKAKRLNKKVAVKKQQ
jgi:redox-sensing transcriptional repressor